MKTEKRTIVIVIIFGGILLAILLATPRGIVSMAGADDGVYYVKSTIWGDGLWCLDSEGHAKKLFTEKRITGKLYCYNERLFYITEGRLVCFSPETGERSTAALDSIGENDSLTGILRITPDGVLYVELSSAAQPNDVWRTCVVDITCGTDLLLQTTTEYGACVDQFRWHGQDYSVFLIQSDEDCYRILCDGTEVVEAQENVVRYQIEPDYIFLTEVHGDSTQMQLLSPDGTLISPPDVVAYCCLLAERDGQVLLAVPDETDYGKERLCIWDVRENSILHLPGTVNGTVRNADTQVVWTPETLFIFTPMDKRIDCYRIESDQQLTRIALLN